MFPEPPIFDKVARIANDNPRAFFEYRHEVISGMVSRAGAYENLLLFQNKIDELRLTTANPRCTLNSLMKMLDGHLYTLSELLAHWQSVLALDVRRDDTEEQASIARVKAMILSVEEVRNLVASIA